jgi:hypothetical protein
MFETLANRPVVVKSDPVVFNQPQVQKTQAQRDAEALEDNTAFYQNPTGNTRNLSRQVAQEEMAKLAGPLIEDSRNKDKRLVKVDPETKVVWDTYKDEIEEEVKKGQPYDPSPYTRAAEVIRNRHSAELAKPALEAQVNAMLEAKLKELGITVGTDGKINRPVGAGEMGGSMRPSTSKVSLTKAQHADYVQMCELMAPADALIVIQEKYKLSKKG